VKTALFAIFIALTLDLLQHSMKLTWRMNGPVLLDSDQRVSTGRGDCKLNRVHPCIRCSGYGILSLWKFQMTIIIFETKNAKQQQIQPKLILLRNDYFEFEVPIVVTMKSNIFWDVAPCSQVEVHHHFRGTYCLCLTMLAGCLSYPLVLKMEAVYLS
jgi:hypothetical protein